MPAPTEKLFRRKPEQLRSRRLFQSILQATNEVFSDSLVPSISILRIAERAGVSVGSVYQYFSSKRAIIETLGHQVAISHLERFESVTDELKGYPLGDAIDRILAFACDLYLEKPALLGNLFSLGPDWRRLRAVKKVRALVIERIARHLQESRQAEIKVRDPRMATIILMHAVLGTLEDGVPLVLQGKVSRDTLYEEIRTLCRRYLLGEN